MAEIPSSCRANENLALYGMQRSGCVTKLRSYGQRCPGPQHPYVETNVEHLSIERFIRPAHSHNRSVRRRRRPLRATLLNSPLNSSCFYPSHPTGLTAILHSRRLQAFGNSHSGYQYRLSYRLVERAVACGDGRADGTIYSTQVSHVCMCCSCTLNGCHGKISLFC